MTSTIKNTLISILKQFHKIIFGHEMSDVMKNFLGHLSWSLMGGLIASSVMMFINILAGRLMGPDEYGKYNLLITISQILIIPILFGLDTSSVITISNNKNLYDKNKSVTTSLVFVIFTTLASTTLFTLCLPLLTRYIPVNTLFLLMAILYAGLSGLRIIIESIIRGLHLFKTQFYGKMLELLAVCSFFITFFILKNNHNYVYYTLTLVSGTVISIIYFSKKVYPRLSVFSIDNLISQISLGKFILLGTILGIGFNSIDKLIIARYLSLSELGIYSAYFMVSVNLIAQLCQMFINVLLPIASGLNNRGFIKKIDKLYSIFFIPLLVSLSFLIFMAISLFGHKYKVNYVYIISFSLLSVLQIYFTINSTILTTISKSIYKKFMYFLNTINLVHLIVYCIAIYFRLISVQFIIYLYIINVIIQIIIQKKLISSTYDQR